MFLTLDRILGRRLAWLLPCALAAPAALEAQACLGFGGNGFVAASGAVWRQASERVRGIGGGAGIGLGPLSAVAHYLRFSETEEGEDENDFADMRAHAALRLPIPLLNVCAVATAGAGGVLPGDLDNRPSGSEPVYGGGLAVGQRFGAPSAGLSIIPSLIVSVENFSVTRLYDDIVEEGREIGAVVRAGVTFESGSIYVRPHAVVTTTADGYLIAGVLFGLAF